MNVGESFDLCEYDLQKNTGTKYSTSIVESF